MYGSFTLPESCGFKFRRNHWISRVSNVDHSADRPSGFLDPKRRIFRKECKNRTANCLFIYLRLDVKMCHSSSLFIVTKSTSRVRRQAVQGTYRSAPEYGIGSFIVGLKMAKLPSTCKSHTIIGRV